MPIPVLMPQLSPTMTEGRLAKWNRKVGDKVSAGDVLAEVETDKATMEIEAIEDGIVHALMATTGTDILVGTPIAILKKAGEDVPADYIPAGKSAAPAPKAEEPKSPAAAPTPTPTPAPAPVAAPITMAAPILPTISTPLASAVPAASTTGRTIASPLAKKLASQQGLDLSSVVGTGPRGRIVAADLAHAGRVGGIKVITRRPDATEKLTPMRKAIAARLTASKQTIPHFYLTRRADMARAMQVREELNTFYSKQGPNNGIKLSVNDLIIKASALALAQHPAANAAWNADSIVLWGNVDISVAVSIPGGLITPIVQNADAKSLAQISKEMKELAASARAGQLKPAQYEGGGFSISNLGMYGIETFAAIVNPPQAAILAVGATQADGKLSLTLSVDHRVIDGALGAELLASIVAYLENPTTMLL